MDPDDLYTLRNLFWLGHYQLAINEANGLARLSPTLTLERDEFVYRSYLLLGQYNILQDEIKDGAPLGLLGIRLLCKYTCLLNSHGDTEAEKSACMGELQELQAMPNALQCKVLQTVGATLHLLAGEVKDALKCVYTSNYIEHKVMSIQILLRMNQVSLAEEKLNNLRTVHQAEDHALWKLASCWVILAQGDPSRYQEAVYRYEELVDKYTASALLLNGLAVANMLLGNYGEAESQLNEALTKPSAETEAIANLIVVQQHLQRPVELVNRTIAQLKSKSRNHPLVEALETFESSFERVSA